MNDYFNLEKIVKNKDGGYDITLEYAKPEACPHCGSENIHVNTKIDFKRKYMDKNGKPGIIETKGNRYFCPKCDRTFKPVDGSFSNTYADSFVYDFIKDYACSDEPLKTLTGRYGITASAGMRLLHDFYSKKRSGYSYELPEELGLLSAEIYGEDFAILYDIRRLELLDIVTEKELESVLEGSPVREIIQADAGDIDRFGNLQGVRLSTAGSGIEEALEILAAETEIPEVKKAVLERDEEKLQELVAEKPDLFPVLMAYRVFMEKGNQPFNTPLPGLKKYFGIKKKSRESALRPELLGEFQKRANEVKKCIENPVRPRISTDRIIGSELFLNQ